MLAEALLALHTYDTQRQRGADVKRSKAAITIRALSTKQNELPFVLFSAYCKAVNMSLSAVCRSGFAPVSACLCLADDAVSFNREREHTFFLFMRACS